MAKTKQKISRGTGKSNNPPAFNLPAISVIIPLYNAERYIGDCLDSLLAQTFQNFEVIVVDDCSTDSSCKVVESYMEKFDGRLNLSHMSKNTSNGGFPRNKGIKLSRGEYIYFVDSDDSVTSTSLEELYKLAKDFDADVVYCENHYETDVDGKNIRRLSKQGGDHVNNPVFQSEDLNERVKDILQRDIWGTPWSKFTRRDVLIENELFFPNLRPCQDYLWTLNVFFSAKKILRVPNAVYIYRQMENSVTRNPRTVEQHSIFWLTPVITHLKWLDEKLGRLDYFKNNLQQRYAVINFVVHKMFNLYPQFRHQLPPFIFYNMLKNEFGNKLGEKDVLVSALFSLADTLQRVNLSNVQKFNQFVAQAQKRIAELESALKARQ